jgi:hypothetical protein
MRIKLFEEFISGRTTHSWSEIRDVLQKKLPFAIICFKTDKSLKRCTENDLKQFDYCNQEFSTVIDDMVVDMPCLFVMDPDSKVSGMVKDLMENYKIHHILIGTMHGDNTTYFDQDGTSYDSGCEIETTTNPSEFGNTDYYKFDSTGYRFLGI